MEDFKVSGIRKTGEVRGLLAFVDVIFFETLTVRNFRIIRSRDLGKIFCCLPVQSFFSQEIGKIDRRTVIKLPELLKEKVYQEILKKWCELADLKFNRNGGDENDKV